MNSQILIPIGQKVRRVFLRNMRNGEREEVNCYVLAGHQGGDSGSLPGLDCERVPDTLEVQYHSRASTRCGENAGGKQKEHTKI